MVINITADQNSLDKLVNLGQYLLNIDYQRPLINVFDIIAANTQQNFDNEGGDGIGWEDLAPRTIREREALGYNGEHPILTRSGGLRDSFVVDVKPISGTYGTPFPHTAGLQYGSENMAARPMLVITDDLLVQVSALFNAHLKMTLTEYFNG